MQRYGDHGHSPEREPLDSDSYGAHPHREVSPDSHHPYSPPEVPYHDAVSPQQRQPPPVPSHQSYGYEHGGYAYDDDVEGPLPPQHHQQGDNGYFARGGGRNDTGYAQQNNTNSRRPSQTNAVTPGADNFSDMAAGGMAGIAYGVAERNARESGMQAIHGGLPPPPSHARYPDGGGYGFGYDQGSERGSRSSFNPLGMPAAAASSRSPSRSARDPYADDHYPQMYAANPRNSNPMLGIVNPNEIIDDGDDGLDYSRRNQRSSIQGADRAAKGAAGAAVTAVAVGGAGGILKSALGRGSKYRLSSPILISTPPPFFCAPPFLP